MFNPFSRAPRGGAAWFNAGPISSFPDLSTDPGPAAQQRNSNGTFTPGCKVFHVPTSDATSATSIPIDDWNAEPTETKNQVLIFRYGGKLVAVNHECPHSSYPLSNGTAFDIEDFGVKLSAGITCPKHEWSFDLFTGKSDRGSYRLGVWETEVRSSDGGEEEVWVRRKQRIG